MCSHKNLLFLRFLILIFSYLLCSNPHPPLSTAALTLCYISAPNLMSCNEINFTVKSITRKNQEEWVSNRFTAPLEIKKQDFFTNSVPVDCTSTLAVLQDWKHTNKKQREENGHERGFLFVSMFHLRFSIATSVFSGCPVSFVPYSRILGECHGRAHNSNNRFSHCSNFVDGYLWTRWQ